MPPSKAKSHPEYDDRLEIVASQVAAKFEAIHYFPCLETFTSHESVHRSSAPRSVTAIYESMALVENIAQSYIVGSPFLLLDDILTSGAHFVAARRRLLERFPGADVKGLFWAKAQQAITFDA